MVANMWRPIESAPQMKSILLFAIQDIETGNWKMQTGFFHLGYDEWEWEGRILKSYDVKPTHWMPLPKPPK